MWWWWWSSSSFLSPSSSPCHCRPRRGLSSLISVSLSPSFPMVPSPRPRPCRCPACSLPHALPFSPRNPPREQLLAAVVGVLLCWSWSWSSWSWSSCRGRPVVRLSLVVSLSFPLAVVVLVVSVVSSPHRVVVLSRGRGRRGRRRCGRRCRRAGATLRAVARGGGSGYCPGWL